MFIWIYHFFKELLFNEKWFGRWAFAGVGVAAYIVGQNSESIAAHFAQPWLASALDYVCGGICAGVGAGSPTAVKTAAADATDKHRNGDP